jgi:pyroglutamyl-peptidase
MNVPCVLITGFEPFAEETVNPSECIVRELEGEVIEGHRIIGAVLLDRPPRRFGGRRCL